MASSNCAKVERREKIWGTIFGHSAVVGTFLGRFNIKCRWVFQTLRDEKLITPKGTSTSGDFLLIEKWKIYVFIQASLFVWVHGSGAVCGTLCHV